MNDDAIFQRAGWSDGGIFTHFISNLTSEQVKCAAGVTVAVDYN